MVHWISYECITGKQYDGASNITQHVDVVLRFFNTDDEDADNEVADADDTTPASRFSRSLM